MSNRVQWQMGSEPWEAAGDTESEKGGQMNDFDRMRLRQALERIERRGWLRSAEGRRTLARLRRERLKDAIVEVVAVIVAVLILGVVVALALAW